MKRVCSLLLALSMLLGMVPGYAFAADTDADAGEQPQAAAGSWDLFDADLSNYTEQFKVINSSGGGAVEQRSGYVNITKGNDKSNTASGGAYTWVTPEDAPVLLKDGPFTVEATIRLAGPVDGTRTNEFSVRVNGTGKYFPIFLQYGTEGGVTNRGDFTEVQPVDTTRWHNYGMVIDPTDNSYQVYVDGVLVLDVTSNWGLSGADLVRVGVDNKGRSNMDVQSLRVGTGDLSAQLGKAPLPEDTDPHLLTVDISDVGQKDNEEKEITVTVTGENFEDGAAVTARLVDGSGAAAGVETQGQLSGNQAQLTLTIPAGLTVGTYYVAVEAEGLTLRSEEYTIETSLEAPGFPAFAALGYTIEMADYQYSPTDEFNFPTIVDTREHPVENELTAALGDFRYYLFYAPHDAPAGNCVAVSNSLNGPWVEYEGNPVVSKTWPKEDGSGDYYYKVSHVSSPQVMWLEEQNCYIMYFHGENPVTRYATSTDLLNWTYGGEIVKANEFSPTGTGFNEASYARVFEHEVPGLGNKYIMLLMITGSGNSMHRNIYWAHSKDGIEWTPVQTPLLNPDELGSQYKNNFSGPFFMPWEVDGVMRYFVICHASSGEIYAFEVGEKLDQCIQWGEVYNSQGVRGQDDANPDSYPDFGRAGAPFFIQDDEGRWHMYYEAGKRLNTNIVHAVEVRPGEEGELARAGLTLDDGSLQVGDTAEPGLLVFDKSNQKVADGLKLEYLVSSADVISYENGVITALAEGTATAWVEVTGADGSTVVSEKVQVTVAPKAELPDEVIITNQDTPNKTALNLELPAIFKAEGVLENPIDKYYLYFSYNDEDGGTRSIALATAPAPQGPWTVYNDGTPVITKSSLGVSGHVNAPWPVWDEDNGRMLMYYSVGATAIGVAESTDGITFTNPQTVLEGKNAPAGNQAYQQSVYEYTVEGMDNRYVMLYTGNGYKSADGEYKNGKQLFFAVSKDGLTWTDSGKVLQFPDSGDKGNIASPRLLVQDGVPYVLYHNSNGNIGYSSLSADFSTAERQGVYYNSADGEPDRGRAADGAILQEGGATYLYYTARSNKEKKEEDASMIVCRRMAGEDGVLFEDDFSDGNADGWEPASGSWSVADEAYVQSDVAGGYMTFAGDMAWTDYEFEARVTPISIQGSKLGVMLNGRAVDGNNRYIGSYNSGKLTINRRIDNKDTVLAQGSYTMEVGKTYTMKMVFRGEQIELWINGVKELEATDSTYSAGRIGFATYQTNASFDDVVVRAISGEPEPAGAIEVEDFGNYQVIQRDPQTQSAQVAVSGSVNVDGAARVEVQVVEQDSGDVVLDWTAVAEELTGASWAGSVKLPQGGWYRLKARVLDGEGNVLGEAEGARKWGVGINILCIGQSNMVGQANERPCTTANDLVANYTRSGSWTHLVDPYDGAGGSMTPALGNYLVEKLGIPVGFVPAADSGAGLHAPNVGHASNRYWMYYNASNPGDTSTLYGKAVTRAAAAGGVELVVWNQGETDGRLLIPEEVYESDMKELLSRLRKDLGNAGLPLFLCQIGTHNPNISNDAAYTAIRNAQHDLDDGENFFLAATEMEFARKDTAHYKKDGMDEIGRRVANSILYYLGESEYYRGPYVSGAAYVGDDRSVIDVTVTHRGGDDITPVGVDVPGFSVFNGTEKVKVLSAVRQDATTIRLTLESAIPAGGSGLVRYHYGLNPFVESYDPSSTASDLPSNAVVFKDNTELELPLEPTTDAILVDGDPEPEPPEASWDLIDHPMYPDWTADGWRQSTKPGMGTYTQEADYVNINKPETSPVGSAGQYHWLVSPATLSLPRDGFTLQVTARAASDVAAAANEIGVRMGLHKDDPDGKLASIFLGYGENGFVSTSVTGTGPYTMELDTTVWHDYTMVVRLEDGGYVFDLYVDKELAFDSVPLVTYKGGDLIRMGCDIGGRCDLDVQHVRLATGEFLPEGVSPARVTDVALSEESQKETESNTVTVTVTGRDFDDGDSVTVSLVDRRYNTVTSVTPVTAEFAGNQASAELTIPAGLSAAVFYVKAEANGRVRYSAAYQVEPERTAPVFPQFTPQGFTIEMEDYQYNPTEEFNFPTIVDTRDHPVSNALGDYRYYLFYAPHDAPAGNCVAASNSLNGPWVEYDANPVVGNSWEPHYQVSHVSSPYVMWNDVYDCWFMYFHGENPTTRYATSTDLLNWTYGGVCVNANDFSPTGSGFSEASYARVFEHEVPGLDNRYIMLMMVTGSGNSMHRNIYWAHSKDGVTWTPVQQSLLNPDELGAEYKNNFSGPFFLPWEVDGVMRYFVICHASSGNMYAFEVGESLDECIEWGLFYDSRESANPNDAEDESAYPDYGRAGAPYIIQDDDGSWHMFYEGGRRLHANIVHATAPALDDGDDDAPSFGGVVVEREVLADGTVVTIETNTITGTVTVTTQYPDGTATVSVTKRDGSGTETLTRPDGVRAESKLDGKGGVTAQVSVPEKLSWATVDIPAGAGNVVVKVNEDGSEQILTLFVIENGRARVLLEGSAQLRIDYRPAGFTDTQGDVAEAAAALAARNVLYGTGGGIFAPDEQANRAAMVTVLHRVSSSLILSAEHGFADVPEDAWYTQGVAWARETGVTQGVGGNRFAPGAAITWDQVARMLYRYAAQIDAVKPGEEDELEAALAWCQEHGVGVEGTDEISRGDLAVILYQYIKALVGA